MYNCNSLASHTHRIERKGLVPCKHRSALQKYCSPIRLQYIILSLCHRLRYNSKMEAAQEAALSLSYSKLDEVKSAIVV